jgi:hypothetical protein
LIRVAAAISVLTSGVIRARRTIIDRRITHLIAGAPQSAEQHQPTNQQGIMVFHKKLILEFVKLKK